MKIDLTLIILFVSMFKKYKIMMRSIVKIIGIFL